MVGENLKGSSQKDENEDEVDKQARAIQEQDTLPVASPVLWVDDDVPIYVPAISPAEIKDITDDFNSKCLIAKGLLGGIVFHGVLKSGQDAAVKKLYYKPDKQFMEEVSIVSTLKHENVVELVGYCLDGDLKVLVSEFAPRGSLHDILHERQGIKCTEVEQGPALSWAQRVKIAVGVARGLCYIHDRGLNHNNIKSSNVLLFDDEIAKIDDLRISTQRPCSKWDEKYPLFFGGRYGWWCNDQTQKSDVYSFGVVLLELLTGRKPFDNTQRVRQVEHLVSWATPHLSEDKVHEIVDARFGGDYPFKEVEKMSAVAALCVQYKAEYRPDMSVVVKGLQPLLRTPTPRVENS